MNDHTHSSVPDKHHNQQSLKLRRKLDDTLGNAITLHNLGDLAFLHGQQAITSEARDSSFKRALALFVHAERIFYELQSPYEAEPQDALRSLEAAIDAENYESWRATAEHSAWQDLV